MERKIFISYSRRNLKEVKAIKSEIERETGVECWMDLDAIESGAPRFTKDITEGIGACTVFLFMLSSQSQESKFALLELNHAMWKAERSKQKHVVIVNIDGCEMCDEFHINFGLTDTIAWQDQPQKEKLLRDLKRWTRIVLEEVECLNENEYQKEEEDIENKILLPFTKNGKHGYKDENGKVVIPCQWDYVEDFSEGLAMVSNYKYVDRKGKTINPLLVDDADDGEDICVPPDFKIERKCGFIDKTGKEVIPCKWTNAGGFSEGLAMVTDSNEKCGFVDKTGKLVIPCRWNEAYEFTEGLARVKDSSGKWGFIDKTGEVVIPCKWDEVGLCLSEGLVKVRDPNGKYGFINKEGKLVIPCKWYAPLGFNEGLSVVKDENNMEGYIDKTGKLVIPCQWKWAFSFHEGLALVSDFNENCGFIDKTGKVVIPCKWKSAGHFCEGLAYVRDSNGYGFIDRTGKIVIPCQWYGAKSFSEGLAMVEKGYRKCGFIDKTGKEVIPCQWAEASWQFSKGWAYVQDMNGRSWHIDKTGKVVDWTD